MLKSRLNGFKIKDIEINVDLKLFGDHVDGKFTLFRCEIEREGHSVDIYLSAEQMNDAAQYDDPFEAVLPLQNMFNECGYSILQTVTIENSDGSLEELEFVDECNGTTHEAFCEEIWPIEISITDNNNIELVTFDEVQGTRTEVAKFVINTEPNDLKPAEIVDSLKLIFNQK